jgi:hypothetical protein
MRRPLAAAAALSFALLAAGCSGDDPAPTAATGTPDAATAAATTVAPDPVAAASADAALSSDSKAICEQAARTSTGFGDTFAADLKLLKAASGKGAEAKTQARQKATRDVESFSFALLDMSKLASDPALKKALGSMGAQVTALKGDLAKINGKKLAALHATLDQACGKS